jgi:hypothetical protein
VWFNQKMPSIANRFSIYTWSILFTSAWFVISNPVLAGPKFFVANATGNWILEEDGSLMQDPQTSGLTYIDGYLYSISDASAKMHQVKQLHKMSVDTGRIVEKIGPIQLSKEISEKSCFAKYLEDKPDYEGLVRLPNSQTEWLVVTEDASRGELISAQCLAKYSAANFTHFPSLLVKLELINETLTLTGVRVLQFDAKDKVDKRLSGNDNIENDGFEGIAITREGSILLGLEKDADEKPRVFQLDYNQTLFDSIDTFVKVKDSGLLFPDFLSFKNPINGMEVYYPDANSTGFLITAARNANQLWILDLAKQALPIIVDLNLYAPSDTSQGCASRHRIRNTALEGVAVHGNILYLINDPWKQEYPNNIICAQDKDRYLGMSPLLFSLPIDGAWFK